MTDLARQAAELSTKEIQDKVMAIVAEQTMVEDKTVTLDATPTELGIDSLGLVEIVFAIEEEFGVTVPYNANDPSVSDFDLSTIGAAASAVERLIQDASAS